ncbi:hypothetical protein GCM10010452_82450 [Crossiella cryophila]|uniref:TNT domain-containing protein n=1 Tax=Crossiella cryophila TaxID=43355 RepID=UPI0031EE791C
MGIELPPEVAQVAKALRVQWPKGDEDKMRLAAKAWRAAGDGVTRLSTETDAVAQHALQAAKGDAAESARKHWNGFVAADTGRMPAIAKGCLRAAQRLEHAATEIAATKTKIIAELLKLVRQSEVAQLLASEGGLEALASGNSQASSALANLTSLTDKLAGTVVLGGDGSVESDAYPVTGPGARDGKTGYQVDPATGWLLDPKSGRLIHPESGNLLGMPGEYVRDGEGNLVYQNSGQPVDLAKVLQPRDGEFPLPGGAAGAPPAAAPGTLPGLPTDPRQPDPGRAGDHEQPSFGPQPGKGAPPPYYDPSPRTGPIELPRQPQPGPPAPPPVYYDPTPTPVHNAPAKPAPNQVQLSWAGSPEPVAAPPAAPAPVTAAPGPPPPQPPPNFQQFGPGAPAAPLAPPPAAPPAAQPIAGPGHSAVGAPHAGAGAGVAVGLAPVPVHGGRGGVGMDGGFGPNKDWRGVRPGAGYLDMAPGVQPIVEPDRPVAAKVPLPARKDDELALFLVHLFPLGHLPRPANRPDRQLPRPRAELDYAAGLRFAPHDHPQSGLITGYPVAPVPRTPGLAADHPAVLALIPDYDPLGGQHERDWDRRFLARAASADRPAEYAWPPAELCPEGGVDPDGAEPIVLSVGSVVDRFGPRDGRVFAVDGTPFTERGLPPELIGLGYHRFQVARELPVWRTVAAPWFGQAGGGVRFRATHSVAELLALGFLVELGEEVNA